jgi:peptidoglycan/xylan/chitin deacetylase (PgdA/CDA1 family)
LNKIKKHISTKLFPVKPPLYADKFLNKFIWKKDDCENLHLTFDDGPTPEITEKILNILDNFKIKATFFCIGRNVEKFNDLYQEILSKGHTTGNHSYSHLNGWKTKYHEYINDVELAAKVIKSNLYRPPYGKIKPKQLKNLSSSYKLVMWDVLSGDYSKKISKKICFENVINTVKNGSIIVFHDSVKASENMLYALPASIEYLLSKGYKFGTL